VQLLEQKIRRSSASCSVLTWRWPTATTRCRAGDMLKINSTRGSFSESGSDLVRHPGNLIDGAPVDISLEGHADLNATGSLAGLFHRGRGPQFAAGKRRAVYLYTNENDTRSGHLSASQRLSFNAALGPVGVTIADGAAAITLPPASRAMTPPARALRCPAVRSFDQISFSGSASATLRCTSRPIELHRRHLARRTFARRRRISI